MAMSLAAGSSDVESDSSAGGVGGRVSRLREGWRVHEDEVGHHILTLFQDQICF